VVDGEKPGVDSRDKGKHTGRNDLLFVEKTMLMDERVHVTKGGERMKNEQRGMRTQNMANRLCWPL